MKKTLILFLIYSLNFVIFPQNLNIKLVKETFFNVAYRDIIVEGNYAYISSNNKFFIYDITNKSNPELLSTLDFESELLNIVKDENFIYVASGVGGVNVIDVINKRYPQQIKNISGFDSATTLKKVNNYLFVGDYTGGIKIVDIKILTHSEIIDTFLVGKYITDLKVKGDSLLYITASVDGIYCYDIKDINNIFLKSKYSSTSVLLGLELNNNYLYLADYIEGLKVFDIQKADSIKYILTKTESVGAYSVNLINDRMVVSKRNISLTKASTKNYFIPEKSINYGLDIYTLTSPTTPNYVVSININDAINTFQDASYIYLVSDNSFRIYDVINVSQPKLKFISESLGAINDIYVEGSIAYIATTSKGLVICDISDAANPTILSNYFGGGGVYSFYKSDTLVYLTCDQSIKVINIRNVYSISEVGHFNYSGLNYVPTRISVSGDSMAYVCGGSLIGLSVLNIKDFNNIIETDRRGYGPLPYASFSDVFGKDSLVFTVNKYIGFYIYSLNPEKQLNLLSNIGAGGYTGVTYNTLIYIASSFNGIRILDVANPVLPQPLSNYDTQGDAKSVFVKSNKAYIANGYAGIDLLDVTIGTNPVRIGRYQTRGIVERIIAQDSIIYTAENSHLGIYKRESLPKYLAVISPNGGERYDPNTVKRIVWLSNNLSGNVMILLSRNGGLTYTDTIVANTPNLGYYDWFIPYSLENINSAKVKVLSINEPTYVDESDNTFIINVSTGVEDGKNLTFNLSQNYPNPFNPSTKINFSVPKLSKVKIELFDILGNRIKVLLDEYKNAGKYTINYSAENISSGIYFYKITAENYIKVLKMNFIK